MALTWRAGPKTKIVHVMNDSRLAMTKKSDRDRNGIFLHFSSFRADKTFMGDLHV
jgi:hypothetical protein